MVAVLMLFSALVPALADTTADDANLLQVRKKSSSRASETEDCTGKDMWMWLGGHREKATDDNQHLWVKQTAAQFAPSTRVEYAKTRGSTCKDWCARTNQVCVRGMDDAHHQKDFLQDSVSEGSRCSIWPSGHDRKSTDEAGCLQKWQTQMCACGEADVAMPLNNDCTADSETDASVLTRACEVARASPNDPYDETQAVDMVLQGDDFTATQAAVNSEGNFVVTSNGLEAITAKLVFEGQEKLGRDLVLPPNYELSIHENLVEGQTLTVLDKTTVLNPEDFPATPDSEALVISAPGKIKFNTFPQFKVSGENVELSFSSSANIVSDCRKPYIDIAADTKCNYQNANRLWRRTGQDTESCYQLCASTPDCKFFSIDMLETSQWFGVCMGCNKLTQGQGHTHFHYYEVCKRADVRGQCEQHEEHKCGDSSIIASSNTDSATECRGLCEDDASCSLFAYTADTKECQICSQHHVFKGAGTGSSWAVMGKDCTDQEVTAKFR